MHDVVLGNQGLVCEANPLRLFLGGKILYLFSSFYNIFWSTMKSAQDFFHTVVLIVLNAREVRCRLWRGIAHFKRNTGVYF